MLSTQPPDAQLTWSVKHIVEELAGAGADPTELLLVGASSRDIIHSTLGYTQPLRGTEDWDFGLVVASWEEYYSIAESFPETGTNGLRRTVAGYSVDLTPFGSIERSDGHVLKPPQQDIDVFGFRDTFAGSDVLELGGGATVRIPKPEGYAALKMRSWLDRSQPSRGEYKDAVDVATAIMWFADSRELNNWLYEDEAEGHYLLEAADYDPGVAAAMYLSSRVRQHLSAPVAEELLTLWCHTNIELLMKHINKRDLPTWPSSPQDQRALLEALGSSS